ncbi:class I SAM-dependent DNA methyltransferase [Deinococcus alpinitundrae]|uniref:class I SAM-dependent DNA methyltransferase n=1 Tax=Deinococcus alpinitundrae TaxID=468913 RepID=UPI0013799838|nr:DNA methyltransferase [Deinococcus alpinitundrae]
MSLTPEEFVNRYSKSDVNERGLAQSHFHDLCDLLGVPHPVAGDRPEQRYRFEQPVTKVTGGRGFADVWFQGHFGWEYKGVGADLGKAYQQLLAYREDLGNPPLLIVSDTRTLQVHTNFTGTQKVIHTFALTDMLVERERLRLRDAWLSPAVFNPTWKRDDATKGVINQLAQVADALKLRGEPAEQAAQFLVKVVFTLFAQSVNLLPRQPLSQILEAASEQPEDFQELCTQLFALMGTGGKSWLGRIPHINGGVFSSPAAPALGRAEVVQLQNAATMDWAHLEPSIFGTLFERVIDESNRTQLGAHYTPLQDILDVVLPLVITPLRGEWEALRSELSPVIAEAQRLQAEELARSLFKANYHPSQWSGGVELALGRIEAFQVRLSQVTVLDPAMGSGNFLFVTLRLLLDLEAEVRATLRELIVLLDKNPEVFKYPPLVGPGQMRGLEINSSAHEIASMVLWIGYLQWLTEHGEPFTRTPVLSALPGLENRDAVLDGDQPAEWPQAEFIIGNPPFVGNTRMRQVLGDEYAETLRAAYAGRVPGFADLVAYWFEKAREQIAAGRTRRAGLIATNSIRGGANAQVLARILETGSIFLAWPDRAWVQDGAAVRVSVVGFDDGTEQSRTLLRHQGDETDVTKRVTLSEAVGVIHADLTSGPDLRLAQRLRANAGRSFEGVKPAGKFDLPGAQARSWLDLPNPSRVSNRDVLKPYIGGDDITDGSKDRWTVDFNQMPLSEAEQYRTPMKYVLENVKSKRDTNRDQGKREKWWLYDRARPEMRAAVAPLSRFIATPRHMKHRAFVWREVDEIPGDALTIITADDDLTFGILNSALHVIWAAAMGTSLEDRPHYTPTTTFETFPFPTPTTPQQAAIEQAARFLVTAREYLHKESTPGRASSVKLSLTGMYNLLAEYRASGKAAIGAITTLGDAHNTLDAAVAASYGWDWPLPEDELLTRLLALNLERAAGEAATPREEPDQ